MRTYRWILFVGVALMAIGWLGAAAVRLIAPGGGQMETLLSGLSSVGLLMIVVGAAGLLMVLITRRLMGTGS